MTYITGQKNLECATLGEAWIECMSHILQHGDWVRDGNELLLEVCYLFIRIHSVQPDDSIIIGHADQGRIEWMRRKYESSDILPGYKVSYGKLLYDNQGVDQIRWVIERLNQKRETKSATITLHQPGEDDLSCLSMLDFKIREDALQMTAVYRSQNAFASLPGNVIALRSIQNQVARCVGCDTGSLYLLPISAHIYEKDIALAEKVVDDVIKRASAGV